MELPNLEGQPGWVIVVVFGLFVFGVLGTMYLRHRLKITEEEAPDEPPKIEGVPDTVSVTASAVQYDLARDAMGLLATHAAKSAQDADRAEQEAKELAKQLGECGRELALCQERYRTLEARYFAAIQNRQEGRQP